MKERIYTIPISEAFEQEECCPFCYLEQKFEENAIDYFLNGAHMEVDGRQETNEHGFCTAHFTALFNSKKNSLGVGLILDTYLQTFIDNFEQSARRAMPLFERDKDPKNYDIVGKVKNAFGKGLQSDTRNAISNLARATGLKRADCTICRRVDTNMEKAFSNFFQTWSREVELQVKMKNRKNICMKHYEMLLQYSTKYLGAQKCADFCYMLVENQINNIKELKDDVNWYTLKFDYRNQNASWKNSKDAVQRGIKFLKGRVDLK